MTLALAIGLVLSPLAGLCAFLIAYAEYQHHYAARASAVRASVEIGLVTLAVFLLLSLIAGVLVARISG